MEDFESSLIEGVAGGGELRCPLSYDVTYMMFKCIMGVGCRRARVNVQRATSNVGGHRLAADGRTPPEGGGMPWTSSACWPLRHRRRASLARRIRGFMPDCGRRGSAVRGRPVCVSVGRVVPGAQCAQSSKVAVTDCNRPSACPGRYRWGRTGPPPTALPPTGSADRLPHCGCPDTCTWTCAQAPADTP